MPKKEKTATNFVLRLPLEESEKQIIEDAKAALVSKGRDLTKFFVEKAREFLKENKKESGKIKFVSGSYLIAEVKKLYDFKPSKQDMQYYRNNNWKKGKEYYAQKSGAKHTFSYNLQLCLKFFKKVAEKRATRAESPQKPKKRKAKFGVSQIPAQTDWTPLTVVK